MKVKTADVKPFSSIAAGPETSRPVSAEANRKENGLSGEGGGAAALEGDFGWRAAFLDSAAVDLLGQPDGDDHDPVW